MNADPRCARRGPIPVFIITWVVARLATFLNPTLHQSLRIRDINRLE